MNALQLLPFHFRDVLVNFGHHLLVFIHMYHIIFFGIYHANINARVILRGHTNEFFTFPSTGFFPCLRHRTCIALPVLNRFDAPVLFRFIHQFLYPLPHLTPANEQFDVRQAFLFPPFRRLLLSHL